MSLKTTLGALLLLAAPCLSQAANLPAPSISTGVGLTIHFVRGNTQDLDLMAAAGVKVVRTDFHWSDTEYQKGVYDWSAYDELAANIVKRGMRPYFILDYSNALYEQVEILSQNGVPYAAFIDSPRNPASVAGFAAWAKAAALHFQSQNVIWEIWNEPNLDDFWKPSANTPNYITLAKATCNAIHGAVPGAAVVGGATSGIAWQFLYDFMASGVLDCLDAISVHPYRAALPETVSNEFQYLQWVVSQYAPLTKKLSIPVISGEWGYSTETFGVPEADQANYLVRMQLNNLLNNIPISIWYDWKNDGTNAAYNENNFGIVSVTLQPKPAYQALKTMTSQLSGYRLVSRIATGNDQDYLLMFINAAGKYKGVVWTTGSAHTVTLMAGLSTGAAVSVVNSLGSVTKLNVGWAGVGVPMTSAPQYLDMSNLLIPAM